MKDIYIGALSGTSMDALDIAAVRFSLQDSLNIELLAYTNKVIPEDLCQRIHQLQQKKTHTLQQAAQEHKKLGQLFSQAITQLVEENLDRKTIGAIGLHGQTILHRPKEKPPFTLQIGDPNIVAKQTGFVTVSDFRQSDINNGGQGAPLAPVFHKVFFSKINKSLAVVNIGGISNITWLEKNGDYSGYDCGPGNILLNAWIQKHRNKSYDDGGEWARSGICNEQLLTRMLDDDFFKQAPPKSACATNFSLRWLKEKMPADNQISPKNIQSSLIELTARCIVNAVKDHSPAPERVLVCGGGTHNRYLIERLQNLLEVPIADTQAIGLPPDWVEAAGFAYLAQQRLNDKLIDLRSTTGARKPTTLGTIYRN